MVAQSNPITKRLTLYFPTLAFCIFSHLNLLWTNMENSPSILFGRILVTQIRLFDILDIKYLTIHYHTPWRFVIKHNMLFVYFAVITIIKQKCEFLSLSLKFFYNYCNYDIFLEVCRFQCHEWSKGNWDKSHNFKTQCRILVGCCSISCCCWHWCRCWFCCCGWRHRIIQGRVVGFLEVFFNCYIFSKS